MPQDNYMMGPMMGRVNPDPDTAKRSAEFSLLVSKMDLFPELVEALEQALSDMEGDYVDDVWGRDLTYLKTAITKAKELI